MSLNWNTLDVMGKIPKDAREKIEEYVSDLDAHQNVNIHVMSFVNIYLRGFNDGLRYCNNHLREQRTKAGL